MADRRSLISQSIAFARRNGVEISVIVIYAAALALLLQYHEFWRDEMQAWMLARDSASLGALFDSMRYEGHPALWHVLLMPLTRISHDPALMQYLNFAISVALVAVVMFASPFTWPEKILFPFGLYILADYGAVSRSYMLGILFVALVCVAWRHRASRNGAIAIGLLLGALANVHILYAIVAVAFAMALATEHIFTRGKAGPERKWLAVCFAITAAGLALAAITAIPEADSPVRGWQTWSVFRNLGGLGTIFGRIGSVYAAIPAVLILLWYFRKNMPVFVFFAVALTALVVFQYLFYDFRLRHGGVYFSVLFAAIWLNRLEHAREEFIVRAVWLLALAAQFISGVAVAHENVQRPRSYGCAVARFIKESGWQNDPIIGFPAKHASTVIGCGDFARAYYPDLQSWGSFVIWNSKIPAESIAGDPSEALRRAVEVTGAPVTLIAGHDVEGDWIEKEGFRKVADFRDPLPIMTDEVYSVYRRDAR